MNERHEFLLEMYRQMFNDINRHIMVVWQSVGVLVGAFAIFALIEKNIISPDIAVSIIVLLCAWLFAHLADAAYWYNRNLVIIANIERQFLKETDLKEIHYYFGKHRPSNKMITHLKIQGFLGAAISLIVLFYHFFERVSAGFSAPLSNLEVTRSLPYALALASIIYTRHLLLDRRKAYDEFIQNSPGIEINSANINYGVGHGFGGTGG